MTTAVSYYRHPKAGEGDVLNDRIRSFFPPHSNSPYVTDTRN